jgi:hypothetical protein
MPACTHENCDKRINLAPGLRLLTCWICPEHLDELWMSVNRMFHDWHQLHNEPRGATPTEGVEEFRFGHLRGQRRRSI